MRIMELLHEHIGEELEDACTYIKLALEYKDSDPEMAQMFYKLSTEEIGHMEALHKSVVSHIEAYKRQKGEPPEGMKALYEFLHRKEIDKAEKIGNLQYLYRK